MNQFFNKIYLINLKRRSDKLASAKAELDRHGIIYTQVQAVDGLDISTDMVASTFSEEDGRFVLALAITLSEIFKDAAVKGYEKILIFEDDIELHNIHIFDEAIKDLPSNFDILYLGAQHKLEPYNVGPHLVKVRESYLCHAMGFGKDAIEYLRWAILEKPNEQVYSYIQSYRDNSFCVSPNIAFQKNSLSDISGLVANYDFILEKEKSLSI